ncbi:MAG: hypothetical protein ACHQNT_02105 [Bacteroidia bacterium]
MAARATVVGGRACVPKGKKQVCPRSLRRPAGEPIQDSPMDFFPLLFISAGEKIQ